MTDETFGQALRTFRRKRSCVVRVGPYRKRREPVSQGALARACRLDPSILSRWESDQRTPELRSLRRITVALGLTPDEVYRLVLLCPDQEE